MKTCSNYLHLIFFMLSFFIAMVYQPNAEGAADNYKCIDKERDALLNFKAYIHKDPKGTLSNWTREERGGTTNNCCDWIGVTCNNHSHVTDLYLFHEKLEGKISHSLLNLSYLNYLNLGWNHFTGTIPKFIGSMTQLRSLDLSLNDFIGTIPSELGNLTNLQHLSLDGFSLAKANDIWVNVIPRLQKLTSLSLVECDLSQEVTYPYSYSSINSSSIVYLDLSGNNKLDEIPRYLGNLCSLRYLGFGNNSMSGKFSDFLHSLSGCTSITLEGLYASYNQFSGSLPDDIQKFPSLGQLAISHNQLNGTISEKVWELPKLWSLDLSYNSLKGTIFENIGKSKIMFIDLSNNSLDGFSFLDDMSNHSKLEEIDLSSNNIYGPIPNVSSTVLSLDFSKNKFNGNISFLCQIVDSHLVILDLSNNSLTGRIPDCLWHFRKLQNLNLGYNKLVGRLPSSIASLTSLGKLYLNNNNFFGELPLSLKNCSILTFLHVGNNMFSGNVPFWIGEELPFLHALSLTSNNFHGTIPLQLCQLIELRILDLSINNLNGTIPACFNNFTAMVQDSPQILHFADPDIAPVYISERIRIHWLGDQREFTNSLALMKIIDLSENNLTGKIPNELADLHKLIALDLSMNALCGGIPSKIGLMKELLFLDLSKNNLSGEMPLGMSQMNFLSYLDVSYNNLSGRIPSSTQLQSFEPSRFAENAGLCGHPLAKYCPRDKELEVSPVINESEAECEGIDELERWFYIGGTTGFAIGFWTICSGLLLYRRGRHAFFHFMNRLEDWVYVKVIVFIVKMQRITHP